MKDSQLQFVICDIYENTQTLQPKPFYAGFRTGSGHIGDQANVILIITKISKLIICKSREDEPYIHPILNTVRVGAVGE